MATEFTELSTYFKERAIQNPDIAHDPLNNRAFFKMRIDEMLSAIKGDNIAERVLIMERPEYGFAGSAKDETEKVWTVAFSIVQQAAVENYDKQEQAFDECGEIMDEFIKKIKYDEEECTFFSHLNIDQASVLHIGPVCDNYFGTRCTFTSRTCFDDQINPLKWP